MPEKYPRERKEGKAWLRRVKVEKGSEDEDDWLEERANGTEG